MDSGADSHISSTSGNLLSSQPPPTPLLCLSLSVMGHSSRQLHWLYSFSYT
jgi:hypothetical protein